METTPAFYIGFCPKCGTGPLGLRTCGSCHAVVVVCDECDSTWIDADVQRRPATTGTNTLACPHCDKDLYAKPSHWSTSQDIASAAWVAAALESQQIELRSMATGTSDDATDDGGHESLEATD